MSNNNKQGNYINSSNSGGKLFKNLKKGLAGNKDGSLASSVGEIYISEPFQPVHLNKPGSYQINENYTNPSSTSQSTINDNGSPNRLAKQRTSSASIYSRDFQLNRTNTHHSRASNDHVSYANNNTEDSATMMSSIQQSVYSQVLGTSNLYRFILPDGTVKISKPEEDLEIEELFNELMDKRNFQALPQHAQNQLRKYSIEKKWLLVNQDLQADLKKYNNSSKKNKLIMAANNNNGLLTSNNSIYTSSKLSLHTSNNNNILSPIKTTESPGRGNKPLYLQPGNSSLVHSFKTTRNLSSGSINSAEPSSISPEYYVKKLISDKLTNKQLNDLWVSVRTQPLNWVLSFLDAQGHIAIANVLLKFYKVTYSQTPTSATFRAEQLTEEQLDTESLLFKSLKTIFNLREGANECSKSPLIVNAITEGLLSLRISTRRLATEMMMFVMTWSDNKYYHNVLDSLDQESLISGNVNIQARLMDGNKRKSVILETLKQTIQNQGNSIKMKRIEEWLLVLEYTLDGRGTMGSLVGASEEFKSGGGENAILEYCFITMLMINEVCGISDNVHQRTLLRSRFKSYGFTRIMQKLEMLKYDKLDEQLAIFDDRTVDDYNMLISETSLNENVDLENPVQLVTSLWDHFGKTDSGKHLISLLQHIFISASKPLNNDSEKSLKILDSLVSNATLASMDNESQFNFAIQRVFDSLQTDDVARKALAETKDLKRKLEEAVAERDLFEEKLEEAQDGLVGKLQREIEERDLILMKNQRVTETITKELEETKKKFLLVESSISKENLIKDNGIYEDKFNNPSPIDAAKIKAIQNVFTPKSEISSHKPLSNLPYNARSRTNSSPLSDGKSSSENDRLNSIKTQMETIEQEARLLESSNFDGYLHSKKHNPSVSSSDNLIVIEKLDKLKGLLSNLQQESNDISRYNSEEQMREVLQEKRILALKRLTDLQNLYKHGQSIDGKTDMLVSNLLADLDNTETTSVTPRSSRRGSVSSSFSNRSKTVTEKLNSINATLAKLNARRNTVYLQDDEKEIYNNENDEEYKFSSISGSGSFLSELSEKYNTKREKQDLASAKGSFTGQHPNNNQGSNYRKSFMNRLKKSSQENFDPAPVQETISLQPVSVSDTVPLIQNASQPPPPPPLPPSFSVSSSSSKTPQQSATTIPAPPPPPPLPSMLNSASLSPPSTPVSVKAVIPPPPPPPPPMMNGVPPPPMLNINRLQGSLFSGYPRPKRKLKQLHWDKLESSAFFDSETESGKLLQELNDKGVLGELEKKFAAREVVSLKKKQDGKGELDKISFLSRDIAQQFGINLHAFSGMPVEELVNNILRCQKGILNNATVMEFLSKPDIVDVSLNLERNYAGYVTEWIEGEIVTTPEKDLSELQRPDQIYVLLMVNLNHYWKARMRALNLVINFEKDYIDLVGKLRKIDKAVDILKNSDSLKGIFEIILAVGNFMNDASKQATGFKLSTLQRLTFIKDDDNKLTFLNYVEKIVRNYYPHLASFTKDLNPLLDVIKISVDQLVNDCSTYEKTIKNVETSLEKGNLKDSSKFHPDDRVISKILPVIPDCKKRADLLGDELMLTMMEFDSLMKLFGEDSNDHFAKNNFFRKFTDFVQQFKKAGELNKRTEEEERAYERRKKLLEEQEQEKQKSQEEEPVLNGETVASEDRNVMDSLLSRLKNAGPSKTDSSTARSRAKARKELIDKQTDPNESRAHSRSPSNILDHMAEMKPEEISGSSIIYSPDSKNKLRGISVSDSPTSNDNLKEEDDFSSRAHSLLEDLRASEMPFQRTEEERRSLREKHRKNKSETSNRLQFFSEPT